MSLRRSDKLLVLLGADASFEAGIPTSPMMIEELENLLSTDPKWTDFRSLYHFIKSAIYYADGITGKFDSDVNYNIERLVNTLSELERKEEHPLYPFIGSWNIKLNELGGEDFKKIKAFRQKILQELQNDWVLLDDYGKSSYYRELFELAVDYQYRLRVFSLNYDLCLEKNRQDYVLERGFRQSRTWDWRNFDEAEGEEPNILLYKLHGSIDWQRDENKNLILSDEPAKIKPEQLEIIFGTDQKLQYTDPFLFFAYEFRRWTLDAELILALGYGFGDAHINSILGQALESASDPKERKLIAVAPFKRESEEEAVNRLEGILNVQHKEQIIVKKLGAEDFLRDHATIDNLNEHFPLEDDTFGEV